MNVNLKLPKIYGFDDYHEICHALDFIQELTSNKQIKVKEICHVRGQYQAIFYYKKQDYAFQELEKKLIEEKQEEEVWYSMSRYR